MKELDSFTVEQLNNFIQSDHAQCGDVAALARIALAAKRAEPVGYWNDACDLDDGAFSYANDAGCTRPLYTTPHFNQTELPDAVNEFLAVLDNYPEQLVPINREAALVKDLRKALSSTPQLNYPTTPMQSLHIDQFGTLRFKANAIVQHLFDVAGNVGVNMNTIAMQEFEPEDEMQFAQLIGYSLSGYGDLSYVTDESYDRAAMLAAAPEKPL